MSDEQKPASEWIARWDRRAKAFLDEAPVDSDGFSLATFADFCWNFRPPWYLRWYLWWRYAPFFRAWCD